MDYFSAIDTRLFLYLNGLHTDWLDRVMTTLTEMWVWLPFYVLLVYWTVRQYGKRCWLVFLAVGMVVLFTDQLSAQVFKPVFHRLRPCYNPDLQNLIHLPKGLAGGKYGFVSSHAANTFGVAAFLSPALRRYRPWQAVALFAWATLASYTRIYIGYHYPGDILCGALLGVVVGWVCWRLLQITQRKI